MSFDTVLMVDWSAANDRGARPCADAIWATKAQHDTTQDPIYFRNRQLAETWITQFLAAEHAAGRRVLMGMDLCFAYPAGFAKTLTGDDDPLALWDWFAGRVTDTPGANNRFDLAGQINARFPGVGPFWGNGLGRDIAHLPRKGRDRHSHGMTEKRAADRAVTGAFSPWQLAGAGAVGSQVIMGLPMLSRLRTRFGAALSVWPFQAARAQIVLAETYFSMLPRALKAATAHGEIKDAAQTRLFASRFAALSPSQWATVLDVPPHPEGWVLGAGHIPLLESIACRV